MWFAVIISERKFVSLQCPWHFSIESEPVLFLLSTFLRTSTIQASVNVAFDRERDSWLTLKVNEYAPPCHAINFLFKKNGLTFLHYVFVAYFKSKNSISKK